MKKRMDEKQRELEAEEARLEKEEEDRKKVEREQKAREDVEKEQAAAQKKAKGGWKSGGGREGKGSCPNDPLQRELQACLPSWQASAPFRHPGKSILSYLLFISL